MEYTVNEPLEIKIGGEINPDENIILDKDDVQGLYDRIQGAIAWKPHYEVLVLDFGGVERADARIKYLIEHFKKETERERTSVMWIDNQFKN